MPLDYGTLAPFLGRTNFNDIREGKRMNLQLASLMELDAQKRNEEQMAAVENMNKLLSASQNLNVLPRRRALIEAEDAKLQQSIYKGIRDSAGDITGYLKSGGQLAALQYGNALKSNEVVKRELANRNAYDQWQKDLQEGLNEYLTFDSTTGKFGGGFADEYEKLKRGEIDTLNYAGAFKPSDYTPDFDKRYADPNNPYKTRAVTGREVMEDFMLKNKGKMPERALRQQALQMGADYENSVKNGVAPHYYKVDKLTPLQQAQLSYLRQKTAALGSGEGKGDNSLVARLHRGAVPTSPTQVMDGNGNMLAELPTYRINSNDSKALGQTLGYTNDKGEIKLNSPALKNKIFKTLDGRSISFGDIKEDGIKSFEPYSEIVFMPERQANGTMVDMPYIKYRVNLDEDKGAERTTINGQPLDRDWFGSTMGDIPGFKSNNWWNSERSFDILAPFEDNAENRTMVENEAGRGSKFRAGQYSSAVSDTDDDLMTGVLDDIFGK